MIQENSTMCPLPYDVLRRIISYDDQIAALREYYDSVSYNDITPVLYDYPVTIPPLLRTCKQLYTCHALPKDLLEQTITTLLHSKNRSFLTSSFFKPLREKIFTEQLSIGIEANHVQLVANKIFIQQLFPSHKIQLYAKNNSFDLFYQKVCFAELQNPIFSSIREIKFDVVSIALNTLNIIHNHLQFPALRSVSINCKKIVQDLYTSPVQKSFSKVHHLSINNAALVSKPFIELLKKCSNLEKLYLFSCTMQDTEQKRFIAQAHKESITIPSLYEFTAAPTNIKQEAMQALLRICANVKNLYLQRINRISEEIETGNLTQLEEFTLDGYTFTAKQLEQQLSISKTLRSISLSGTIDLSNLNLGSKTYFPNPQSFNNLEELYLPNAHLEQNSLNQIQRYCPRLKVISITDKKERQNDPLQFPVFQNEQNSMVNFNATNIAITTGDLEQLLHQSHVTLKRLNLSNCSISNINAHIPELGRLESFIAPKSKLTHKDLQLILSKAKNLKELDISDCKDIEGDLYLEHNLESLQKIKLSFASITKNQLQVLLNHCPNIVELNITYCRFISDEWFEFQLPFSKLDTFIAENMSWRSNAVRSILKNCPNLNRKCSKIRGDLPNDTTTGVLHPIKPIKIVSDQKNSNFIVSTLSSLFSLLKTYVN